MSDGQTSSAGSPEEPQRRRRPQRPWPTVVGTVIVAAVVWSLATVWAELPATAQFVRVDGGIHSFFGDYGVQRGDGTPTISRERAQAETAAASIAFLESVDPSR